MRMHYLLTYLCATLSLSIYLAYLLSAEEIKLAESKAEGHANEEGLLASSESVSLLCGSFCAPQKLPVPIWSAREISWPETKASLAQCSVSSLAKASGRLFAEPPRRSRFALLSSARTRRGSISAH